MMIEQNTDDAWNLFNLISKGDLVYGKVMRKVSKETLTGLV
jgi:stalled ribosome rescue protein Dom34